MNNIKINDLKYFVAACIGILLYSCVPTQKVREENKTVPKTYANNNVDTLNTAKTNWKNFFSDINLISLIDTALVNNQEMNIMLLKVDMFKNKIKAKKGEYLPFVNFYGGAETEKVGAYTRNGSVEEQLKIDDEEFPDPLSNYSLGISASWELDIWKKLRNEKKAAVFEYLSSVEGKKFMTTNLVAEIADTYYELLALDNQLDIVNQNLEIQKNALKIVKLQKQAAKTTELAVRRFKAEVLKNQSEKLEIEQQIVVTENKINFLIGKTPQKVTRKSDDFLATAIDSIYEGVPSQLLQNRPDIRKAEYELAAAKLNTKVARANFYPSFGIKAGVGLESFKTKFLTNTSESLAYSLVGDFVGPLINKNAIKAAYKNANDMQLQSIFEYEKTILSAYIEVSNELSNIKNLKNIYDLKEQEVDALTESIQLSTRLFKAARADYLEVLLTQREALDAKIELVETKKEQLMANVAVYKSLGGGWN
ncbi:TolC family protein [Polaribacter sargassicola]|uniref:TolC family protein n=1 Tax=Polaribacter sargassicola TaxID=2836891 RepID=UPI001F3F8C22|nr:TolC family protein [Polaribacter sp. DS7-9]MCG1036966.1 TolC family protein [Polaribacter sp. DS7-9]